MKICHHRSKHQQGFTLIEVMLVLVIAAIIAVTALVAYQKVQERRQEAQTVQAVQSLMSNIYQVAQTQSSFQGLDTAYLLANHLLPNGLVNQAGTDTHTLWGGTVTSASTAYNGISDQAFQLTFDKVPSSLCALMATQLLPPMGKLIINQDVIDSNTGNTPSGGGTNSIPGLIAQSCARSNASDVAVIFPPPGGMAATGAGSVTSSDLGVGDSGTLPANASSIATNASAVSTVVQAQSLSAYHAPEVITPTSSSSISQPTASNVSLKGFGSYSPPAAQ